MFGTREFHNTAEAIDRLGCSSRAAAYIINSFQADTGNLSQEKLLDPHKLDRDREKSRKRKIQSQAGLVLAGFGFDGRKDPTKQKDVVQDTSGKIVFQRTVTKKQENLSIVANPGNIYLGHCSPEDGTAQESVKALVTFFERRKIDYVSEVKVINSDGCNTNTGHTGGIIALFEEHIGRPVQWSICILHHLERPWLNLFLTVDGRSLGPDTFDGPLGKLIGGELDKLPVEEFEPIDCPGFPQIPPTELKKLSKDQQDLYHLCICVISGVCPLNIANLILGLLSLYRWLTFASRVIRLYISTQDPSEELIILVKYAVQVYAHTWFEAKWNFNISQGSKHLFDEIQRQNNFCDSNTLSIVRNYTQINGFFAHEENVLLYMLASSDMELREQAIGHIIRIRNIPPKKIRKNARKKVRKFVVPKIKFDAKSVDKLIDLSSATNEPPLTMSLSLEELNEMLSVPFSVEFESNSQPVERAVKGTTESVKQIAGVDRQDGYTLNKCSARSRTDNLRHKKHFRAK